MSHPIAAQLIDAAEWAELMPDYKITAPRLRWLAKHVEAGEIDLSRLSPPSETEGAFSGLLARLRDIGVDVWEMCPRAEEVA